VACPQLFALVYVENQKLVVVASKNISKKVDEKE
jgi:hypothetical protein